MTAHLLPPESVTPTTPLRLAVAAALAYPDGSMTASGLRHEARKGRLVIERTAGKDYTTLAYIEIMREKCRLAPKAQDCGLDRSGAMPPDTSATPPSGSLSTEELKQAHAAAQMTIEALKARSPVTFRKSTSKGPAKGNVVPLKSRSPT